MRYLFWVGYFAFLIAAFALGEVIAVRTGKIATLSESLRKFYELAPQYPFLAAIGLVVLAWHLWGPPLRGLPW